MASKRERRTMESKDFKNSLDKVEVYMLPVSKKQSSEKNPDSQEIDSTTVPTGDFVYCPEIYEARCPKSDQKEPQVRVKKSRLAQRSKATEEDYRVRSSVTLHL